MKDKNTFLNIVWSTVVVLLIGVCVYEYCTLSYNLKSLYDEAYFYILSVFSDNVVVYTYPPSLAMDALHRLIPNVEQCDVLTMRHYAYAAKAMALVLLLLCSCFFVYKRHKERKLYPYLALAASTLLIGIWKLPSISFSWDDVVFCLVTNAFSLCLLYAAISKKLVKNIVVVLIGIVALFTLLCNLPAGCMLTALCALFLILEDYQSIKLSLLIIVYGLVGLIIGLLITHLCIIPIPDILEFLQEGFSHTAGGNGEEAHSLTKVVLVIFFGIRDLLITTLLLCGITYIGRICHKVFSKSWLTISVALVCFAVAYIWQAKPEITMASIMCWFTIMFLVYHMREKVLNKRDVILVLFAFILPIGAVFGTNTSILGKAIECSASWGFLIFYLYYLSRLEVRKYVLAGLFIAACVILTSVDFMIIRNHKNYAPFEYETRIKGMQLNASQKAFYDEVYAELSKNGYEIGKDTILGFGFNDMTILAMGAMPYTNDQQPGELLQHDFRDLPVPDYIIFTEWDSVVLCTRLSELDWDFPEAYKYYKCINNPDPNSGYNMTQSIIYSRK